MIYYKNVINDIYNKIFIMNSEINDALSIVDSSNLTHDLKYTFNIAFLTQVKELNKYKSAIYGKKTLNIESIFAELEKTTEQLSLLRNLLIGFIEGTLDVVVRSINSSQQVLDNNFLCQLELFKKISVEEMV